MDGQKANAAAVLEPVAREADPELQARWLEPHPGGGTTRDRVMEEIEGLRSGGGSGSLSGRDLRGLRLIEENLRGIDFSGADLSGADLSCADLSGANLMGAKLRSAVLYRAKLERTEMTAADLRGANLEGANCGLAGLGGARLTGARLFSARLEGATLTRADLSAADARQANLRGARVREASLVGADLSCSNLRDVDLGGSDLSKAVLDETDLRDTRLLDLRGYESARWIGADIRDVNWSGAYLVRRFIQDQNYLDEFRRRSSFCAFVYKLWWVTSDCGRSLSRWGAWTAVMAIVFTGIYTVVDIDYGSHETWLSPFYYSVVTLSTLGYGDVLPASVGGQVAAICQVCLGYVALGGLITIFSNKLARRAD